MTLSRTAGVKEDTFLESNPRERCLHPHRVVVSHLQIRDSWDMPSRELDFHPKKSSGHPGPRRGSALSTSRHRNQPLETARLSMVICVHLHGTLPRVF